MRPKVSVIAPCYNKRDYIGAFLESIYRQDWDYIELILINNGSSDGSEIYVRNAATRLRARGYEVVFIDFQENIGLPGAMKAGLLRITGEYVCMVDCDDELYPDYVSAMAEYMEAHPQCGWCVCDFDVCHDGTGTLSGPEEHGYDRVHMDAITLDAFATGSFCRAVWRFCIRTGCLDECAIITNFPLTEQKITHEAYIEMPLLAHVRGFGYVKKALYKYRVGIPAITNTPDLGKRAAYENTYLEAIRHVLGWLDIKDEEKQKLLKLARAHRDYEIASHAISYGEDQDVKTHAALDLAKSINDYFSALGYGEMLSPESLAKMLTEKVVSPMALWEAVEHAVLGEKNKSADTGGPDLKAKRVIGCGALGKLAAKRVRQLAGTMLAPDALWDEAAENGAELYGIPVTKPDFAALEDGDILLVFPKNEAVVSQVGDSLRLESKNCRVLYHKDIVRMLPKLLFPKFYMNGES